MHRKLEILSSCLFFLALVGMLSYLDGLSWIRRRSILGEDKVDNWGHPF